MKDMGRRIIALGTDWGKDDGSGSVAEAHAVILGINPDVNIIDMSHEVQSYDVRHGAMLLMTQYRTYPKGTIFVMVVDPGVGTQRLRLLVETFDDYYFISPDNGLLGWVLQKTQPKTIVSLTNRQYFRQEISPSFEGRDVFAPVAAYLSNGVAMEDFGKIITPRDIICAEYPLDEKDSQLIGEILFVDKFGNITTSIGKEVFRKFIGVTHAGLAWAKEAHLRRGFKIHLGDVVIGKLSNNYKEGEESGAPLAIFSGVFGDLLDISIYEDSAAEKLGVKVGDKVAVTV